MYTSSEIEGIPVNLVKIFNDIENRVMSRIVEALSINGSNITRAIDWQLYRLYELGKCKKDIKEEIQKSLKLSDEEIDRVFSDVIKAGYARDDTLYKAMGQSIIPYEKNRELQQLVSAVNMQAKEDCRNITDSLGFSVKQLNGTLTFKPIAKYYQDTLDGGLMEIATGITDYNTVLKRVVSEMTNSGLRSVDYASGWSNRVDVAARRALMTGFNQVVAKVNEDNAKSLGTEYFEVSYHGGARPTHQVWQGRVYKKDQLVSVCGLGDVTGLCGANCYHSYSPFFPGVSQRTYTDEELEKMNKEENTPKEYKGKMYTTYEALQKQRRLETTMRAQRHKIKLLESGGADEDDILTAKVRYNGTSDEYVKFSKAMGLPQQRQRVNVDELRAIGNPKYDLKNAVGKGIIKVNKVKLKSLPNIITQRTSSNGGFDRNYYDSEGRQIKQITNHNHGNASKHPYGKNGEHTHDYIYNDDGTLNSRPVRGLTNQERKENGDIL